MATIRERNGSYEIRVSCGYDSTGKQVIKQTTWKPDPTLKKKQKIKEALDDAVNAFTKSVRDGKSDKPKEYTLAEFCPKYLEYAQQKLSPNTLAFYKSVINNIIIPKLGDFNLKGITRERAQDFILSLSGEGIRSDGRGTKLSAATVKRYFTVLKSIMAKAYNLDLIEFNPTDTKRLDIPVEVMPDVEVFSKDEAAEMLTCLKDEPLMFQVLIHLAIVTGCRRGELVALKWDNIDFDRKSVNVQLSNYKLKGEEIKSKAPKTKSSIREIAIPEYLVELLQKYRVWQSLESMQLGDKWVNGNWIFTQWDGEPMNPQTPTRQFSKFLKRHNIPHRKFHALRHTSATLLLSSGTNIKTVASRLGHTQLTTTNRYVHALRDADEAAAQTFENLIPIEIIENNEKKA